MSDFNIYVLREKKSFFIAGVAYSLLTWIYNYIACKNLAINASKDLLKGTWQ